MLRVWDASELNETLDAGPAPLREVTARDIETLGGLFWLAFGHGGVDGFNCASDAETEVRGTLAGKWGPVVWEASLLAQIQGQLAAASIVVRDDAHAMRPLLAFLVTDPVHQGHGLGAQLIQQTLICLNRLGVRELHLAVDRDNPARRLYERMGFWQP